MSHSLLEARHVSKSFPGVQALDDVSLSVDAGEILALVGHNGSGKSSLVKVMAGVYQPDLGEIDTRTGGDEADEVGLHFIHQDLGLVPMLSAADNMYLDAGRGIGRWLAAPTRRERKRAHELILRFGAEVDVAAPVGELTTAERTIVAIARALNGWTSTANVLVLDEPTAALQEEEVRTLFEAVKAIADQGSGVIFISHRLDEVVELADRVVVLRDGRVVANKVRGEFDRASLVSLVANVEEAALLQDARSDEGGEVTLAISDLHGVGLDGISLDVRAGEIVGVTGLLGSGTEQLSATVFGLLPHVAGIVSVGGRQVRSGSPSAAIKSGMGFVPADRRRHGGFVTMTAAENITMPRLSPVRGRLGQIKARAERLDAQTWMDHADVKPSGAQRRLFGLFSGGNQQKLVMAKWLRILPKVLLLDEPTQGVDVGAQAGVHALIARAARDGAAVLVSSTDTKELVTLCHRVMVLHKGRVATELQGDALTEGALIRATLSADEESQSTRSAKDPDQP